MLLALLALAQPALATPSTFTGEITSVEYNNGRQDLTSRRVRLSVSNSTDTEIFVMVLESRQNGQTTDLPVLTADLIECFFEQRSTVVSFDTGRVSTFRFKSLNPLYYPVVDAIDCGGV